MNRQKFAQEVQTILCHLYPNPPVPLCYQDTYTLLIAVLLSARCTDLRVNQVTPALFARADTPEKMMQLKIEEIQALIRPCGLSPQKARAIWELSYILIEKYESQVPAAYEALELLPGVGHKTASIVMSQGFGFPAFPVDTHVHRCAKRWGLSEGRHVKQTEQDLKALFPESSWNLLHLQMIYFGREFCPARRHTPSLCPICSLIQ